MTTPQSEQDEYNLQEAWDRVCTSFMQTTNADLKSAPTKYTIEEVLDQIRAKQDEANEKNAKYQELKTVMNKTLTFVGLLGGIAAQGASMVFAPSSLCFNAVAYLINTGAKYKRIFSSLAELFRKVSDMLDRLQIYMRVPPDAVDIALRRIINDQLLCFVDICALSIKVLKGHKVLIAIKVFAFGEDEGVSGQLARLESLVERESQMRATLGFESQKISERGILEAKEGTKKINVTVTEILDLEKKRNTDHQTKKELEDLDRTLDKPSESWRANQSRFRRLLDKRVAGSGEWLAADPFYTSWAQMENPSMSILGIAGGEGYGKSLLFTSAIKNLQESHSPIADDSRRTSVAYCFCDQERGTAGSLIRALKVLAWQIANTDPVYRKELVSTQTASAAADVGMLWNQLFAKSYRTDSTFFLLLDGLEQVNREQLKQFVYLLAHLQNESATLGRLRLRILLSGQDDAVGRFKDQLGHEVVPVIDLALKNSADLHQFIENRIDRLENLAGSSEDSRALRSQVMEALTAKAHGDFINAGLLLDEVGVQQRPSDIRAILSRSGSSNREDTFARKIARLNETLRENDITDLNEILTWMMYAPDPVLLAQLETVLLLKNGERSLKPLWMIITDHYSALISVVGVARGDVRKDFPPYSRVVFASDAVKQFLRDRAGARAQKMAILHEPASSLSGQATEGEIRIVRRFLESVCDPDLFRKLGFEQYFGQLLKGKTAAPIGIDAEDTAHLRMLSTCLKVINSDLSSGLGPLLGYAMNHFAHHLTQLDPSLVEVQDKLALGPPLVKLFQDPQTIQRWWRRAGYYDAQLRLAWIYTDSYSEVVVKWLQESAIIKGLSETQKDWVRSLTTKSEPDADLLEHIARHWTAEWLLHIEDLKDIYSVFPNVYGYFSKVEHRKNPQVHRVTDDSQIWELEISRIFAAVDWGRQQVKPEVPKSKAIFILAMTLHAYRKFDEAIEQYKLAISLTPGDWNMQWRLAEAYSDNQDFASAIQTLEAAKGLAELNHIPEGSPDEPVWFLASMRQQLAWWYNASGQPDRAFAMYEALMQDYSNSYRPVLEIMRICRKGAQYSRLLQFLQSMEDTPSDFPPLNQLTRAYCLLSDEKDFHDILFTLVRKNIETFGMACNHYRMSIAHAADQCVKAKAAGDEEWAEVQQGRQGTLMYYHALLRYEHSNQDVASRMNAIEEWERLWQMEHTNPLEHVYYAVRRRLPLAYFHEARQQQQQQQRSERTEALWLTKLEQLAELSTAEYHTWADKQYPARLLARYHALRGDLGKAQAVLRAHVKIGLDILSDTDPLNDPDGYFRLAFHFMFLDLDDEALAAWSMIVPKFHYGATGDNHVENKKLEGPLLARCDGKCGTTWTYANDFYVCKECQDVQFDRACLERLRQGTLELCDVCAPDHEMLYVPAYDPARRERVGEGNIQVGTEPAISVEEWVARTRQYWGIKSWGFGVCWTAVYSGEGYCAHPAQP
ncbi:hypothetical protein ASPACDRAFT_1886529 [Aspergillus aculeatus ATCC 16872]|uniref:Uncharacterized protein n=1 Tax=Aspergillus aculeatus (strain ATCC 16872 / CBS 172.66 / WB 5094) TaxID=690307 RepID=A0A1L9X0W1_ASPA1|nr:uncharacterized protein ASPACDRAFT_1886529 [Aspergillus aculeatus ATCC 16872]OJK02157.1 hypothetical protein ASPACDRAFT_1886529 [Aspergillus aculeatus ATCC 16872]